MVTDVNSIYYRDHFTVVPNGLGTRDKWGGAGNSGELPWFSLT